MGTIPAVHNRSGQALMSSTLRDAMSEQGATQGSEKKAIPAGGPVEAVIAPSGTGEPRGASDASEPLVIRMPVDVRNLSLTAIGAFAGILVLQLAQSVLIPIVLAVLISYALAPMVGSLARHHVPRAIGAALAVCLLVGSLGVGVYTLSDETMSIVSNVPAAARRLRERVLEHRRARGGALQQMQQAANELEKTADVATKTEEDLKPGVPGRDVQRVQVVEPTFRASDYLWTGGVGLLGALGQFTMILFLVYFLLLTGDLYKRKLVKIAGPTLSKKRVTVQILDDINGQIESFIKVQFYTSVVVAVATAAALWWLGLQNYAVWGLLAGVFNSIPYLGPVVVTGGLGVVAFMQFNDLTRTAYVCGAAFAITSLEGFLLTPALMSRAAQMNAVAIFIGLLFWSWIWGVWGTILAVPLLMMVKSIADHVEDLQPIGELLGE
jgi:predicted PurR-regulated permease PerM